MTPSPPKGHSFGFLFTHINKKIETVNCVSAGSALETILFCLDKLIASKIDNE